MNDSENFLTPGASLFLKYNYPETKEMCKHFLTLVSGILVLSITFSEKIVVFKTATKLAKGFIIGSWITLLISIILCGLGLTLITIAAGNAVYGSDGRYLMLAQKSYWIIIGAGGFFIIGLMLMISSGITAVIK